MKLYFLCFFLGLFVCNGSSEHLELTDEEYYEMPDLFSLDNYERCLSKKDNVYCLGSFELTSRDGSPLLDVIKKFSENVQLNFNHTKVHRGVCLGTSRCKLNASSRIEAFETCVDQELRQSHGFNAKLLELHYCRNKQEGRKLDFYDYLFILYALVILGLNVGATVYDVYLKDPNEDGNRWLMCFSMKANWKRFTGGGGMPSEKRYHRFKCFHGMKAILTGVVVLAHALIVMIIYTANPRYLEQANATPEFALASNGTLFIQTFIVMSTFLRAFKTMIDSETEKPGIKTIISATVDRFVRISPLFMSAVGFTATLAAHISDGPLWRKYVESDADNCRTTFWRQFFLMQHLYAPVCLPQAWYLSMDFQLYVISTAIFVFLLRNPQTIVRNLVRIFLASLVVLYAIIYTLELKPSLQFTTPETLLNIFQTDKSFTMLYQSIWGNFPTAMIGTLAAYVYYQLRENNVDLKKYKLMRWAGELAFPAMMIYILTGYFFTSMTSRFSVSLYATLDKPIYAILVTVLIYGCLYECDHIFRRIFEWSGWAAMSRLSLASLLFHTVVARSVIATKLYPQTFTKALAIFDWLSTMVATLLIGLPLCLMIEYPFLGLYKNFMSSPKVGVSIKINKTDDSCRTNGDVKTKVQ